MTKVHVNAIRNDASIFVERRGKEKLAVLAEVGTETIDNLLNGNFEALNDKYLAKIKTIVKNESNIGLYRTTDCMAFLRAADEATEYNLMVGITGDTGTGKTFMSTAVAQKNNVLYWNCHMEKSPRVFFQELLCNLRASYYGTISAMIEKAAKAMNEQGTLLIIDEADKMHPQIRACVHTLRDRTAKQCGIMLVGMVALKNDLITGKEQGKKGYAEFSRRVNIWHHMDGLQPKEINKVLEDNGITEPGILREFRHYTSFGELVNAIQLHKILNS